MTPIFSSVMQAKGINPAAVREAVLQSQGMPLSQQLATGIRAPAAASEVAQEAIEAARKTALERAQAITGKPPPPETIAQMLQKSQTAAHTAASQQYGRAFAHPGEFASEVGSGVLPAIEQNLRAGSNLPSLQEIRISPSLVKTNAALNHLEQRFTPGVISEPFDMPFMERTRKELTALRDSAQGSDQITMQNIVNGFDNHLINSLEKSLFSGNGQQAVSDMKKARQMWADLQDKYYKSKDIAGQAVNRAVSRFTSGQSCKAV